MKSWIFLLLVVVLVAAIAVGLAAKGKGRGQRGSFAKKKLATPREQAMYWRLVEALPHPEYIVLAQVSFGALLNAREGASRFSFSQKIADFVVTDKAFAVLAVIELDDASHRGKEDHDLVRDIMLTQAGYRTLRYAQIPDAAKLRNDLAPIPDLKDLPPMRAER